MLIRILAVCKKAKINIKSLSKPSELTAFVRYTTDGHFLMAIQLILLALLSLLIQIDFLVLLVLLVIKLFSISYFRFKHVIPSGIKYEIKGLNPNKATTHNNILPKILRQSAEVTANTL